MDSEPPKLGDAPEGVWLPPLTPSKKTLPFVLSQGGDCDGFSTFDVPIFTEEFLDQNKGERRLGLLRGSRCQGRGWAIRAPRQRQEVGGIYP